MDLTRLGRIIGIILRRVINRIDPALLMLVLGPLMVVVVWTIVMLRVSDEHTQATQQAFATATGLARVFDEQSQRTLGAADQMIRLVRQRYLTIGQTLNIAQVLADAAYITPAYLKITISDAQGNVIASSTQVTHASMKNTEAFTALSADAGDSLYIGKPVFDETGKRWTLQLSRRIERRDGTFAGVVVASLEPAFLLQALRDADFGPQDIAALVGLDGITRVRLRGDHLDFNVDISTHPVFRAALDQHARSGRAVSVIDDVERFVAWMSVNDYPLVVAVGLASDRAMMDFDRHRRVYFAGATVFSVCVLVLTLLAGWLSVRQRSMLRKLASSEREANELKSSFIANISHDLRTPLNGIIGFADVIRETAENPDQRQYAQYILDSGNHLLALVNMLLDLTKMRASKLHLQRDSVDLKKVAAHVANTQSMAARKKGLEFQLRIADDFPQTVPCDAVRIRQVMNNLVHNAIKFTERGGVTLELLKDGARAIIRTTDTGIGMSREDQSRLFEFFAEGRDTSARKNVGSGLGLAFSKELVKLHGGTIEVMSVPGSGTNVTVSLPLV